MIIIVSQLLFSSFVFSCSDCFSKCSEVDKNKCLATCGCPQFTSSYVKRGSFKGKNGMIYVPEIKKHLVGFIETSMGCNLACSEQCSLNYLDLNLESCVDNCGCGELLHLLTLASEDTIESSCNNLCKGSGNGCFSDCMGHFESDGSNWYLWLALPILIIILVSAFIIIKKKKKEDDYLLM